MFEFARKKYRIAQGENREARPEGFFRQGKDRREVSFPGKRFRSHRLGGIFILYGEAHNGFPLFARKKPRTGRG